jgi:hypothetical protein
MFRHVEEYPDLVLTGDRRAAGPAVLEEHAPVFDRLRADMGLTADDDRSGAACGRHVRLPEGLPAPTEVAQPTVDLLERVLADLRGWGRVSRP